MVTSLPYQDHPQRNVHNNGVWVATSKVTWFKEYMSLTNTAGCNSNWVGMP